MNEEEYMTLTEDERQSLLKFLRLWIRDLRNRAKQALGSEEAGEKARELCDSLVETAGIPDQALMGLQHGGWAFIEKTHFLTLIETHSQSHLWEKAQEQD